jgi:hypothetical protein
MTMTRATCELSACCLWDEDDGQCWSDIGYAPCPDATRRSDVSESWQDQGAAKMFYDDESGGWVISDWYGEWTGMKPRFNTRRGQIG